jgi:hypothetical protein
LGNVRNYPMASLWRRGGQCAITLVPSFRTAVALTHVRTLESVISDYEYRQRVCRYKPSSLVPLIAAAAARYW